MEQETYIESTAVPSSAAVEVLSQSYRRPQVNPTVESNPAESSAAVKQESHVTDVSSSYSRINRSDPVLIAMSDVMTDDDESEYTTDDSQPKHDDPLKAVQCNGLSEIEDKTSAVPAEAA